MRRQSNRFNHAHDASVGAAPANSHKQPRACPLNSFEYACSGSRDATPLLGATAGIFLAPKMRTTMPSTSIWLPLRDLRQLETGRAAAELAGVLISYFGK